VNKAFIITLLTLLVAGQMVLSLPSAFSTPTTALVIIPLQNPVEFPQLFTVNVTVVNVTNLSAWQIEISFNPTVLEVQNVTLPSDHIFSGHLTTGLSTRVNNTLGTLTAFNGLFELNVGVNGTGALCQIIFSTQTPGLSVISFNEVMQQGGTYLVDPQNNFIYFETQNTVAQITAEGFQTYTFEATKQGTTYNVNIFTNATPTSFNFNETSEKITYYLNGQDLSKALCSLIIPKQLMNGTFAILANSTALPYTISQDAQNHYPQFSTTLSTKKIDILTTVYGDINGDRKVDMRDVALAAKAFGTSPGDERWNPIADINRDSKVDMKDIAAIAKNFGKYWIL